MAMKTKVKRVSTKRKIVKRKTKQSFSLPETQKEPENNISKYPILFYGRAGIGKTTLFAGIPGMIMFSCERVSKRIRCFDFNSENGGVTDWNVLLEGIKLLEKTKHNFSSICFDTADTMYKYALNYVCNQRGLRHPSDIKDYGGTWTAISLAVNEVIDKLQAMNFAIYFTSHAKEVDIESHSGEKYTLIQPTMTGAAYTIIKARTDFILYGEFVKDLKGNSRRIIITQGDEIVDAKSPDGLENSFPRFLPLEKKDGFKVLERAFLGEEKGIPVSDLIISKQTTESGASFLKKEKASAKRKSATKKRRVATKRKR